MTISTQIIKVLSYYIFNVKIYIISVCKSWSKFNVKEFNVKAGHICV